MSFKKKLYDDIKHDLRLNDEEIAEIKQTVKDEWFGSLIVFFLSLIGFSILAVVTVYYVFMFLLWLLAS